MSIHVAIPEPTSFDAAYNQRSLPQYFHSLYSAGATPIPIPLHESPRRVARILSTVHGILLPGSPADIDPRKYGESPIPECHLPDPARAAIDELLLEDAFNLHKPVLAICQGAQALNVWRRGTLIQDIPVQIGASVNHSPGRAINEAHAIAIAPGTRLAAIAAHAHPEIENGHPERAQRVEGSASPALAQQQVNSSHHQAIRTPGDSLVVSARSPQDNVIEAVELPSTGPNAHFVLAVQWHPERAYDQSAFSRAIFRAFVHACDAWAPPRIEESVLHA